MGRGRCWGGREVQVFVQRHELRDVGIEIDPRLPSAALPPGVANALGLCSPQGIVQPRVMAAWDQLASVQSLPSTKKQSGRS